MRQYLPAADGRGLPSARVEWLAADPGGGVWIGSAAGLARWQGDRFQPPTLLGATTLPVTALGLDAEGAVWSSTADGTQVRRLPGLQPANGEGNPGRRWLGHSRGGGQWFSDSGQVWWQDSTGQNARAVALPAVAGRTLPRIARVVEDRYGRVWLLGSHQGVWRLGAQWRHTERFKATGGAAGEAAGALAPAADGNAWYVRGGWLTKVSPTRGFDSHRWSYAHDLQRADRHVVVEDRHGQVWVFAAPWLTRLDPLRGRSERWRLPDAEGAEGVATAHAVLRICGDQLWLAGQGHLQQRTTQGVELGTWSYDAARLRPGRRPSPWRAAPPARHGCGIAKASNNGVPTTPGLRRYPRRPGARSAYCIWPPMVSSGWPMRRAGRPIATTQVVCVGSCVSMLHTGCRR
ncbi:hypothetical protein QT383_01565 [Stenotrophomonas rhizophila]